MNSRSGTSVRILFWVVALSGLTVGACTPGFQQNQALSSDDRNPRACYDTCAQLGMQMGAYVLVQQASGCVCVPTSEKASAGSQAAAATGGGYVVLAQQQAARRQQQQQRR